MDVKRSFYKLESIPPETLTSILKGYAVTNPALGYCQGMNFMAGFLYLSMNFSEALSYTVMREVIAKFSMVNMFNKELPLLKQIFYQLDRLISIYLPDLHNHFKDETINSSYFSSSFFVTLFTIIMQN